MNVWIICLVPHSIDKIEAVQTSCQDQPGLRLSWTSPQSDLPIQHYAVTHAVHGVITGNITTVTPNVTVCNLPMGILHEVSTVAVSALGSGREGAWTTVRTPTGNTIVYSVNVFQMCILLLLYIHIECTLYKYKYYNRVISLFGYHLLYIARCGWWSELTMST